MSGRITELLPRIYHNEDAKLIEFVELLEPEIDEIESLTAGITEIIDIDKTPSKYLSYVAAMTNVPLVGDSPALWRRQIKKWPSILKIKGTEKSIELAFETLGIESVEIATFWRDADGNLTDARPSGTPFKDSGGVWRNSKTHYFSVLLFLSTDSGGHAVQLPTEQLHAVLKSVKPIYAELVEFSSGVQSGGRLVFGSVADVGAAVEVWPMQPQTTTTTTGADFVAATTAEIAIDMY